MLSRQYLFDKIAELTVYGVVVEDANASYTPHVLRCTELSQLIDVKGQSRRMRPACFSSECPLLPGSDS